MLVFNASLDCNLYLLLLEFGKTPSGANDFKEVKLTL